MRQAQSKSFAQAHQAQAREAAMRQANRSALHKRIRRRHARRRCSEHYRGAQHHSAASRRPMAGRPSMVIVQTAADRACSGAGRLPAVAERLCNVDAPNMFAAGKIGQRTRNPQDTCVTTG